MPSLNNRIDLSAAPALAAFLALVADVSVAMEVEDAVRTQDAIHQLLNRERDGLRNEALFRLRRAVKMAAIADQAPSSAVTAIYGISDAVRKCHWLAPLSERGEWLSAIELALGAAEHWDSGSYHLDQYSREHAVVHAAQRLAKRGYAFEVGDNGLHLRADAYKRLCTRLDKDISALGGRFVVERVFTENVQRGRMFDGSLLGARQVTPTGGIRKPSTPWHFLFQLGMKHVHQRSRSRDAEKDWQVVVELARDLCATFDVEPYSSFDGIDIGPKGIQETLQEAVLYDEMFTFPQWQPKHVDELLDAWLIALNDLSHSPAFASLADWRAIARSLLRAPTDRFVVTVPADHVVEGMAGARVAELFERLAAGSQRLNTGYVTPLDTAKRSASYIPLIALGDGFYLVPPKALLARALCEWFYKNLRDKKQPPPPAKPLENAMGDALERVAQASVRHVTHDRILAGKKYFDPASKKDPEVDLLIETNDRLFLIECKKKALTNRARGGDSVAVLLDLSASLLKSLFQLARHERLLRSQGEITFLDGTKVALEGREVEKIAVSLLDHGSLHDRIFISALVRGLFGAEIKAYASERNAMLAPVNKALRELNDELAELAEVAAGGDIGEMLNAYTLETWWLGVDVLHYLCREGSDLWAALRPMRHLTGRSRDIMSEIASAKSRRAGS